MAWIIRDADWFIEYTNGKFGVTRSPKKATQFKSQTMCENVITSSLSKKLKDGHNWESCFVEEPQPQHTQFRETELQPHESKEP